MKGQGRGISLALLLGCVLSAPAGAQVVYSGCWAPAYPIYYYPIVWPQEQAVAIMQPAPARPANPLQRMMPPAERKAEAKPALDAAPAKPRVETAAPPEKGPAPTDTVEPAAQKRAPAITESRFQGPTAPDAGTAQARCRVGFWNLTGRDVTLTVDGRPRELAKDRAVTLDLPLRFAWQVDREPPRTEQLPAGQNAHEIVIRQ